MSVYPSLSYDPSSGALSSPDGEELGFTALSDPLAEGSSRVPDYLKLLGADMNAVFSDLAASWTQGSTAYFLSTGLFILSIFSLFFFCFFSQWRLLNLMLCLSAMRGLFFLWPFLGSASAVDPLRVWTSELLGSDRSVQVVFLGISCLCMLLGIVRLIDLLVIHPEPAYE